MATLILLRHGQSVWNAANIFTGWTDVDLSEVGEVEAAQAVEQTVTDLLCSDRIKGLKAGVHSTSDWGDMMLEGLGELTRAQ